jgi:AcrR family transcriptional regulator
MANDRSSSPSRRTAASTKQHLLEQATGLFENSGFATPLRVLFQQANITPPTLYGLIGSKDDLIVAVVTKWCEDWLAWMDAALNRPGSPHDRLGRLFNALERWLRDHDWHGSLAANAAATLNVNHPVQAVISEYRKEVRQRLRALAVEAGTADPNDVARRLQVLLDGAMAGAQMEQGSGPVRAARRAADVVLTEV